MITITVLILTAILASWLLSMTAATVYISESNGAGETVTDNITNLNFGSTDAVNLVAANYPIVVGENSFWKFFRFKVSSLGTSTTIKDLRYWKSAGALVTGEAIQVSDRLSNSGGGGNNLVAYLTPLQSTPPAGLTNNGTQLQAIRTADPGSAVVGIAGSAAGTIIAAPAYSEYMFAYTTSTTSTPAGAANTKTITFQYDET